MFEDNTCESCKFYERSENEEPCRYCKHGLIPYSKYWEEAAVLWQPKVNKPEKVNHPSHYNQGGIECIDAMVSAYGKEAVSNFCLCNAFKYVWRTKQKNGIEDIDKAIWYLTKFKELTADEAV